MEANITAGEALRKLRDEAGITQEQLAERVEQPQPYVSKLESGERALHVADLDPLADALGVNVTTILNYMTGLDSVLDRWELSEAEFTELIDDNPFLARDGSRVRRRGEVTPYVPSRSGRHQEHERRRSRSQEERRSPSLL